MIETFYGLASLDSPMAFLASLCIGLSFGFALERAGFGSSRRLAGIFYLRDMAVLKVMFTAMITAMLGLAYARSLGWIQPEQLFFMPTIYGAQIAGGLLFGVGFVMSGWCPGTGAVGLASGKGDALVFLLGAVLGSILFNEVFPHLKALYSTGDVGVLFVYENLDLEPAVFAVLFTLLAIGCFWISERIERRKPGGGAYLNSPFLRAFSVALIMVSAGPFLLSEYVIGKTPAPAAQGDVAPADSTSLALQEVELLQEVEAAADHMEPEELADRLMAGDAGLFVVDVRPAADYRKSHIRGAVHIALPELIDAAAPYKNKGIIVLYSNGMTHPALARDTLRRLGFMNAYILTDGLIGFMERCLKPVSLRSEPVPEQEAVRINAWRAYFYGAGKAPEDKPETGGGFTFFPESPPPGLVDTGWLEKNLGNEALKIIDVRSQAEYNRGHIPGALCVSMESFRGVVGGVPSMLLPGKILALQFSQMGIQPLNMIILVPGEYLEDATLVGLAFERLGHLNYAVLYGGFHRWLAENRPVDTRLPEVSDSQYPEREGADGFILRWPDVLKAVTERAATIIDARPSDYFQGKESDEARAGHIPGAVNRPSSDDVESAGKYTRLRPLAELSQAYAALIPSKDSRVIVHCRTGHKASQTFFVLKHLLGYKNVYWYDAGWTEWAARPELPVEVRLAGPASGSSR